MNFRFNLERGSRKHLCPGCRKKRFVRYVDSTTGEYLPERFGRCDREANCGYHLKPENDPQPFKPFTPQQVVKDVFYPLEALTATRYDFMQNTFVENLTKRILYPLPPDEVRKVAEMYRSGSISRPGFMQGAVTFPFIDEKGRVHAIQVKQFDEGNHTTRTNMIHAMIKHRSQETGQPLPGWLQEYEKQERKIRCLFGAHLLKRHPRNPVAIVEAPKTAFIASLFFGSPEASPKNFIWLAAYNLSSLKPYKCRPLAGRRVVLFPDLSKDGSAFERWSEDAARLSKEIPDATFIVSDLLERKATPAMRLKGADLADYLSEMNWRQFRPEKKPTPTLRRTTEPAQQSDWSTDVEKLENWFRYFDSDEAISVQFGLVSDVKRFVSSHLSTVKANNGNRRYEPYLLRLKAFVQFIEQSRT